MREPWTNYTGLIKAKHAWLDNPRSSKHTIKLQHSVAALMHEMITGDLPTTFAERKLGQALFEYLNSHESRRARGRA